MSSAGHTTAGGRARSSRLDARRRADFAGDDARNGGGGFRNPSLLRGVSAVATDWSSKPDKSTLAPPSQRWAVSLKTAPPSSTGGSELPAEFCRARVATASSRRRLQLDSSPTARARLPNDPSDEPAVSRRGSPSLSSSSTAPKSAAAPRRAGASSSVAASDGTGESGSPPNLSVQVRMASCRSAGVA